MMTYLSLLLPQGRSAALPPYRGRVMIEIFSYCATPHSPGFHYSPDYMLPQLQPIIDVCNRIEIKGMYTCKYVHM